MVVSKFWAGGTVFAAAMTPVVVSIIKELLERPMQSEVVRRSASRVTDVAVARRAIAGGAAARTERERESSPATGTVPPPSANGSGGDDEVTQGDVVLSHPRRTYGAAARRRLSPRALKIGIVTGLLAFVLAAVALTVPELLFGGSVGSGDRSTTIFGGGKDSRSGEERDSDGATQQPGSQEQPSGEDDQAAPGPAPEDEAAPETEEPAPAEPPASEPAPAPAPVPAPTTP